MFPTLSWAYQSLVSSTIVPSSVTVSLTTRAVTPFAIFFFWWVTTTTTFCSAPSESNSRYVQRVPGFIGQYGLVMWVVKSAGSSLTRVIALREVGLAMGGRAG